MDRLVFYVLIVFIWGLEVEAYAQIKTQPRTGFALVHGTNDHSLDALGTYWKPSFVDALSNAFFEQDLLYVVHCDYSDYMWSELAAGCTANQLLEFIDRKKLDKLVVYAHSNGANVMRWIISNPTYDPRYMELFSKVSEVIAASPSSGGTPLADEVMAGGVFETGLGWLLGYKNNAVAQQRVGNMALYNQQILLGAKGQPSLSIPFKVVVSSDVTASPLNSASYCNGFFANSALKITKIYLDYCADGFVDCSSQEVAGKVWFYDYEKSENENKLSHNQSRHNCFGLDRIVLEHLLEEGALG